MLLCIFALTNVRVSRLQCSVHNSNWSVHLTQLPQQLPQQPRVHLQNYSRGQQSDHAELHRF